MVSTKSYLGISLLIAGILIASLYNYPVEKYVKTDTYSKRDFTVSGYFNSGDRLVLDITPDKMWSTFLFDWIRTDFIPEYEDCRIQVKINNTYGESTVIDIIFLLLASPTGEEASLMPYAVYPVNSTGGLTNIGKAETEGLVEATVETEGEYTASIVLMGNLTVSFLKAVGNAVPPKSIRLLRYVKIYDYKYRQIAPVGGFLIVAGLTIIAVDYRWAKKVARKRHALPKRLPNRQRLFLRVDVTSNEMSFFNFN